MMNQSELTKYAIEIATKLGNIEAKLTDVCQNLMQHEQRICNLENKVFANSVFDGKILLKLLGIALLIIASLSGASSIVAKFLA